MANLRLLLCTDAGYFGAKKGAEPLHIQWNAATDAVEVVNYSDGDRPATHRSRRGAEHRRLSEMGENRTRR